MKKLKDYKSKKIWNLWNKYRKESRNNLKEAFNYLKVEIRSIKSAIFLKIKEILLFIPRLIHHNFTTPIQLSCLLLEWNIFQAWSVKNNSSILLIYVMKAWFDQKLSMW